VKRFRGGLVFKAYRLLYHSTLGLRVMKKKKNINDACGRDKIVVFNFLDVKHIPASAKKIKVCKRMFG